MKRRVLAAAGLVLAVYLCALLALFPASLALRWFLPAAAGLTLATPDGTIWNGRARDVAWRGVPLGDLEWELRPLALLTLTATADVELQRGGAAPLTARVRAGTSGRIELENVRGGLTLADLAQARLLPANIASGEIVVDLAHVVLQDGQPLALDGRAGLNALRSSLLPGVALGSYEGEFETTDQGIRGVFREREAPLRISGEAQLQADGSYRVNGSITPLAETPDALRRGLTLLGQPDASGRYDFRFNGRL